MVSTPLVQETASEGRVQPTARAKEPAADRFMRSLLRVDGTRSRATSERSAHRYLRLSMVITGIRCLITYLAIPIAVPIIGLSGAVSAPLGLALSAVAVVTGILSLRRFWESGHRFRWMYTGFIAIVFLVLAITVTADISAIVGAL